MAAQMVISFDFESLVMKESIVRRQWTSPWTLSPLYCGSVPLLLQQPATVPRPAFRTALRKEVERLHAYMVSILLGRSNDSG